MSTLRVDNIKGRTGTTVNIPDSNNLSVSGSLNVTGVTTFSAGAELNLQGVNLEEEAIQLMRYQQALQAAAQLVSIADTVFQAMLTATQR